jgi:hypothetical protein
MTAQADMVDRECQFTIRTTGKHCSSAAYFWVLQVSALRRVCQPSLSAGRLQSRQSKPGTVVVCHYELMLLVIAAAVIGPAACNQQANNLITASESGPRLFQMYN